MGKVILWLLLISGLAFSQSTLIQIVYVQADPTGLACGYAYITINITTSNISTCRSGVWVTAPSFTPGSATLNDPVPASSYFVANNNYHSFGVNQGAYPVAALTQSANHSNAILGTTLLPAGVGLGGVVAIGGEFYGMHQSAGSAAFGIFAAGLTGNTGGRTFGANFVSTDCSRKGCADPGAVSFAATFDVTQENDLTISNPGTKIAFAYSAEMAPSTVSAAGTGSVSKTYGFYVDDAADTIASTVTPGAGNSGVNDTIISALASNSGNNNWNYCQKWQATGTPDLFSWTPFGSSTCLTASDLAAPTGTTVTSASHWPAINGGAAIGFTQGDKGQVIQVTSNTGGWNAGFYAIPSVAGGTATLDSTVCSSAPCSNGSYVIWEASQATIAGDTLTVQATTTQVIGTTHTFVTPADVNEVVTITATLTGSCNLGILRVVSVSGGTATLSGSAGTNTSTCAFTLTTIRVPTVLDSGGAPVWLTLPLDSTTSPYLQGAKIRSVATSFGVAIDNTATTGHTVGDFFYWAVTGVPNFGIAYNISTGSANTAFYAPPLYGGPSSSSIPLSYGATDAANPPNNLQASLSLSLVGNLTYTYGTNGGAQATLWTFDPGGDFTTTGSIYQQASIGSSSSATASTLTSASVNSGGLVCPVSCILNGTFSRTSQGAGVTDLMEAASATITSLKSQGAAFSGQVFTLSYRNLSATNAINLATGTGYTFSPASPWTIATNSQIDAQCRITGLAANTISCNIQHTSPLQSGAQLVDATGALNSNIAGESPNYATYGSVSLAQINAGITIVPATTGRTIKLLHFLMLATGTPAVCTAIQMADTAGTPIVGVSVGFATLSSGAVVTEATAGVTLTTFLTGLTAAQGLQIIHTGSSCTTLTSMNYEAVYTYQ